MFPIAYCRLPSQDDAVQRIPSEASLWMNAALASHTSQRAPTLRTVGAWSGAAGEWATKALPNTRKGCDGLKPEGNLRELPNLPGRLDLMTEYCAHVQNLFRRALHFISSFTLVQGEKHCDRANYESYFLEIASPSGPKVLSEIGLLSKI